MQPVGFHCGQGSTKTWAERERKADTDGAKGGVRDEQLSHPQIFAMCFHSPPHVRRVAAE